MARMTFKWDAAQLNSRLLELSPKLDEQIRQRVELAAVRGEEEMKIKAPWTETGMTNRWGRLSTGAAREGLKTRVVTGYARGRGSVGRNYSGALHSIADQYSIVFSHSVKYGIWLEIAMSGRFQIIMPTVVATGRALMMSFTDMLGRLDNGAELFDIAPSSSAGGTSQSASVVAGREVGRVKRTIRRIGTRIGTAIRWRRRRV